MNMGKLNLWHLAFFPSLLSENDRVLFNTNMSLCSFHLQRIELINIKSTTVKFTIIASKVCDYITSRPPAI